MDEILDWSSQLAAVTLDTVKSVIQMLPQLLGVLAILLTGWVLAWFGKIIVIRLVRGVNRVHERIQIAGMPVLPKLNEPFALVISRIVFWIIILLFLAFSSDVLGLGMFADWLSQLVNHLPNIVSGALIIWAGVVFSGLIAQTINTAAINLPDSQRFVLSKIAQFLVLIMLVLIGVDQIGVDISIVVTMVSVTIGAALGGLAIAFSLGARPLVSNLIGVRYLNPEYRLGQRLQIGAYEGIVVEITSVSVILDTEKGRVTIPAQMFSEQPSTLVVRDSESV